MCACLTCYAHRRRLTFFFRIVSLSLLSEEHSLQLIYLTTNPTNPRPPLTPYVAWLFAVWTFSLDLPKSLARDRA
jgi:hypothetical protein